MTVPFLDLQAHYAAMKSGIDEALRAVVDSQQFILGPAVARFEGSLGARVGTRHMIGCASGTDALLLSLRALQLEPGDEVVVPTFTFFATAGAVWNAGLRPVFADVDADTFNLTPETVAAALTPRTRAIVVVHLYGQMAPMAPILELARSRGIAVIEDVAQALGARQQVDGQWREGGTLGDAGAFSFFPTKILGGFGDGGAVCSDDDELAERVRKLRVHGGRQMYHHEMVGTNSRLDSLQAAVLDAKLPYLDRFIEGRRTIAARYDAALAGIDRVRVPVAPRWNEHVYGVYTIRVEDGRDALRERLAGQGIGSSIYYPVPLHEQECFRELGYGRGDFPVAERLAGEVLSLPIYPEMPAGHVDVVADAIRTWSVGG